MIYCKRVTYVQYIEREPADGEHYYHRHHHLHHLKQVKHHGRITYSLLMFAMD